MQIEKAPMKWEYDQATIQYNAMQVQRDADHEYYTKGEGRKQIHREELKQFVKWLKTKRLLIAEEPPVEGHSYQFLGCHILRWDKRSEPTVGLCMFSYDEQFQALLKEAGEDDGS